MTQIFNKIKKNIPNGLISTKMLSMHWKFILISNKKILNFRWKLRERIHASASTSSNLKSNLEKAVIIYRKLQTTDMRA